MLRRRKKIFTGRKNESLEELVRERGEHYAPPLYLSFSHLWPDMGMQKRILKIGLPQAVEVFGMWGIQMFCLSIISELPVKGVLGVHNIAVRIESLSFLPGFAIGMAASTLVGQRAYGPHHHLEMHAVRRHLHDRPGSALQRLSRPVHGDIFQRQHDPH